MLSLARPAKGAMTSVPLAFMAFLLLFGARLVLAGPVVAANRRCIDATDNRCQGPFPEEGSAHCCPAETPVCTSVDGSYACVSESKALAALPADPEDQLLTPAAAVATYTSYTPIEQHMTTDLLTRPPVEPVEAGIAARDVSASYIIVSGVHGSESFTSPTSSTSTPCTTTPAEDTWPVFTQYPWPTGITYIEPTSESFTNWTWAPPSVSKDPHASSTGDWAPIFGPPYTTSIPASTFIRDIAGVTVTITETAVMMSNQPRSAPSTPDACVSDSTYIEGCLPTFAPGHALAARHDDKTTISISGDDIEIVSAQNSVTTFPIALITNSAAPIPISCQQFVTSSGPSGTSVFLTLVSGDCTVGTPTFTSPLVTKEASTESTLTTTSTSTSISSTTSTTTESPTTTSTPTTTISSTSTSTSTSIVPPDVYTKNVDSMVHAEHHTTTISTTEDPCAEASTVTVTMSQTVRTTYVTEWLTSNSSSVVVVSSTSSDTSVDGITTTLSWGPSHNASSSATLSSQSTAPGTPVLPTTPMIPTTPRTPSPTVPLFNGGASSLSVSQVPGTMVILCLAWFVLFQ